MKRQCVEMVVLVACLLLAAGCYVSGVGDAGCWECPEGEQGSGCLECPPPSSSYGNAFNGPCDGGYCSSSSGAYPSCVQGECPSGTVCSPYYACESIIPNCPLRNECLGAPEHWSEYREGVDSFFVGHAEGPGLWARIQLDINFYADFFIGEGFMNGEGENRPFMAESVQVAGQRNGTQLTGQVISSRLSSQWVVTFTAELLSGSEMAGGFVLRDEIGRTEGTFTLFRTSPCGCNPEDIPGQCRRNADCANGGVCVDGACVECFSASDCPPDNACINLTCVPQCSEACCEDAHCEDGQHCVEHQCRMPCTHRCDCPAGEVCEGGFCSEPTDPPPRDCVTDCDCDYHGGERCVDKLCVKS